MMIRVFKADRVLCLMDGDTEVFRAPVALGREPVGPKTSEGDGKTPEGLYHICLCKEAGRHGQSLGLDYPGMHDAALALAENRIDPGTYGAILAAHHEGRRPPWGSPLGGEIYLHAGGAQTDWTQGCIALEAADMARLYALRDRVTAVEILPGLLPMGE
jgi:murein L,D-transpeptidase YafK